jgi:CBS domain-containing protein
MFLPISHLMRSKVTYCEENTTLRKVSEKILEEKIGSIVVNRGEESVGIITTNDLLRAVLAGLDFDAAKASEIMSQPLETFGAEKNLDDALKKFEETGRTRLVILKGGKVIGILKKTIADRFKGVSGAFKFSAKTRSLPFRRG